MKRTCTLLIAAALLASGCGSPEDKFVGTWTGEVDVPPETIDAMFAGLTPEAKEMVMKEMGDVEATLTLNEDGTYSQTSTTPRASTTVTGTWTLNEEGTKLTISEPDRSAQVEAGLAAIGASNMPLESVYDVQDDGATLHIEQEMMGLRSAMTFRKN